MADATRTLVNGQPLKWTGRAAAVLQEAMFMSNERFAAHLGAGVRSVAEWHAKPRCVPNYENQEALDTCLAMADPKHKERFVRLFPLAMAKPDPVSDEESVVVKWTGELAQLLMHAFRMTQEQFAAHLGVSVRTVGKWAAAPESVPRADIQQILDDAHDQAPEPVRARFARFLPHEEESAAVQPAPKLPAAAPAVDPVVAQMAADMALMQARIDSLQEQLGALALRVLT